MSFQAMTWAAQQKMSAPKKCLLYTLANYAGHDGKLWPSYQTLADDAGLSRRTVINYMEEFEKAGIIKKVKRVTSEGDSDSNLWVICGIQYVKGSEPSAPPSANDALPSESDAPPVVSELHQGSEPAAPKPVIESVKSTSKDISASGDASRDAKSESIPYREIVGMYHRLLPELPRVVKINVKRKRQISARWKEIVTLEDKHGNERDVHCSNLEFWEKFFKHVSTRDFLMGRKEGATWCADLEFLTREEPFLKILGGGYANDR